MQIDWFTFVAQIINFGILLWLLNRFLYVPITMAVSEREAAITGKVAAADSRFSEAGRLEKELRARQEEIDSESESLRAAARDAVEKERDELLAAVRQSVDQLRSVWLEQLEREAQLASQSLRTDAATTVVQIASSALGDLAGEDLDERIIATLISRLGEIDAATRESIRQSLEAGIPVTVTTGCKLNQEGRAKLEAALQTAFGTECSGDYRVRSELIGGVRLAFASHEISWSIDDYLETIRKEFSKEVVTG